LVSSVLDKLAT